MSHYENTSADRQIRQLKFDYTIPSRQDAESEGCIVPDFHTFLSRTGLIKYSLPFDVPDELTPTEQIAYQLLPAFLAEYGDKYPYNVQKPKFIAKMWIDAMQAEKFNKTGISSYELRPVVARMASNGQAFNPKVMVAVAAKINSEIQEGKHPKPVFQSVSKVLSFYPTVELFFLADPIRWCHYAGYPNDYLNPYLSDAQLNFITHAVHYRYKQEDDLDYELAVRLTEQVLTITNRRLLDGEPMPPYFVLALTYRFSVENLRTLMGTW